MKQWMRLGIIGAATILALGNVGMANTLDLTGGFPDITSFGLSVNYTLATGLNAGTDTNPNHLSVMGTGLFMPVTLDNAGDMNFIDGSYDLEAYVDNSGNLSGSMTSTLTIDGTDLLDSGYNTIGGAGELFSTLTDIGTNPGNDHIEFLMNSANYSIPGGAAIGPFTGGNIDISSISTPFNGWNNIFGDGGSGAAMADTFRVVPTPAALPAGLAILGGIFGLRKKLAR